MKKQLQSVEIALRAKTGVVWVKTVEEKRVQRELIGLLAELQYNVVTWSVTRGLVSAESGAIDEQTKDPATALTSLMARPGRMAGLFADAASWFGADAVSVRTFKDTHERLKTLEKAEAKQVIVIDSADAPKGVPGITVVEWPLPDREECEDILNSFLEWAPDSATQDVAKNGNRDGIVSAMLGLAAEDAAAALSRSLAATGHFDPALISKEKAAVVRGSGLEWYDADPRGLDAVGGLEELVSWLSGRRRALSKEAREWGLPAPKGCLTVGVPGCGKSLTAKAVASAWGVPLLRLDMGGLRSKYVGESEGNLRRALATAEAVAPCVLWLDEIEKAMGGSGSGVEDGGVRADALGTLLTWMQERKPGVFLYATSNDVKGLPPELLRAGRWDCMWWVDLPTQTEREAIAEVMGRKFRHVAAVDASKVATCATDRTGAEIEQAYGDALYTAFENGREVTTDDVLAAMAQGVPLAKTMAERIDELRKWASGRARPASRTEARKSSKGRAIE